VKKSRGLDQGAWETLRCQLNIVAEYFDELQDVKITKEMLDLAKHIVEQKSGHFDPDRF